MIGRVVGSYKIVDKVGTGGMGTVFRAVDLMLEREVALKAIRPDLASEAEAVERFRAEARMLARVSHPAIATIYSLFAEGDELFLAMEFVRGQTLSQLLRRDGAMPWEEALALLDPALSGIEEAHRAGIVHRDLKPENLMIGEGGGIKVMDFGIARMVGGTRMTKTGLLVGTLRYMAPEQIRGEEVDRRTDVYSLGAVLYEMLTGHVPFDGSSDYAVLKAQVEEVPQPPSVAVGGLPDWLDDATLRALAKRPEERFQSVAELQALLARRGGPGSELPAARLPIAEQPTRVLPVIRELAATPPPLAGTTPAGAPASSYRDVRLGRPRSWPLLAASAALVAVIALGAGLWLHRPAAPAVPGDAAAQTGAAKLEPHPAAAPPLPVPAAAPPVSVPPPESAAKAQAAPSPPPPSPSPVTAGRESRKKARPQVEPLVETAAPPAAPVVQETEPSPRTPAPAAIPSSLPMDELRPLAGGLVTDAGALRTLYDKFLDEKKDSGGELSGDDDALRGELKAFEDAADAFDQPFRSGFLASVKKRVQHLNDPEQIVRRARALMDSAGRVEALLPRVKPVALQQAWRAQRNERRRIAELCQL